MPIAKANRDDGGIGMLPMPMVQPVTSCMLSDAESVGAARSRALSSPGDTPRARADHDARGIDGGGKPPAGRPTVRVFGLSF